MTVGSRRWLRTARADTWVRILRPAGPNLPGRIVLASVGLTIFAIGVAMNVQAGIGLQPWWALHYGLSQMTPMTIGQASIVTGIAVIGLALLTGVKPGLATALNIAIVGVATDTVLALELVPKGSGGLDSYLLLVGGVLVLAFGTAVYVKANLGAGPRDSLMLGLASFLGGRIGLARYAMDVTVTVLGLAMGAPIWIGTLVFAFGTGPAVALWFRVLRVPVKRKAARRAPATSR